MENIKTEGFEMPVVEVVLFESEDIITISGVTGDPNETPFAPA